MALQTRPEARLEVSARSVRRIRGGAALVTRLFEFCMAIETYKKANKKMYPTWTEVLEVVRHLGYRKVQRRSIRLQNCREPDFFRPGCGAANGA